MRTIILIGENNLLPTSKHFVIDNLKHLKLCGFNKLIFQSIEPSQIPLLKKSPKDKHNTLDSLQALHRQCLAHNISMDSITPSIEEISDYYSKLSATEQTNFRANGELKFISKHYRDALSSMTGDAICIVDSRFVNSVAQLLQGQGVNVLIIQTDSDLSFLNSSTYHINPGLLFAISNEIRVSSTLCDLIAAKLSSSYSTVAHKMRDKPGAALPLHRHELELVYKTVSVFRNILNKEQLTLVASMEYALGSLYHRENNISKAIEYTQLSIDSRIKNNVNNVESAKNKLTRLKTGTVPTVPIVPMPTYQDSDRIMILKAVQKNAVKQVANMLEATPALISAKTKSMQSSLLHIAAERGYFELCQLLLKSNHEVNPVDINGITPYGRATCNKIKALCVEAQLNYFKKKYQSKTVRGLSSSHKVVYDTLSAVKFEQLAAKKGKGKYGEVFGITILYFPSMSVPIRTIFDEDRLMMPYYGELLFYHEHIQILQMCAYKARIEKAKTPEQASSIYDELVINQSIHEVIAFTYSLTEILMLYPDMFNEAFPSRVDRPELAVCKKELVVTVMLGMLSFYAQLDETQIASLNLEHEARLTLSYVSLIYSPAYHDVRRKLLEEDGFDLKPSKPTL